jgi:hypothetical protein
MQQAVTGVIAFFGNMYVCDGSAKVNVTEKVHKLMLSGTFMDKFKVMVCG